MIPVLRSIDTLLNRFDELSQRHANFLSTFDRSFTDVANPLRDVSRDEEEQRKTNERLLNASLENDDQVGSFGTVDEFNRRVTKNRCQNRPPSYASNETTSHCNRIPSRNSYVTMDSASFLQPSPLIAKQLIVKPKTASSVTSASDERFTTPKTRAASKIKPKILPENDLSRTDPYGRNIITAFTVETVNRLSKPRTYNGSPMPKVSPKRVYRRSKMQHNVKKESSEVLIPSVLLSSTVESPTAKRTSARVIRSSPKKLKADKNVAIDDSKNVSMSNYPRPVLAITTPATICLTFPMQPELKSSRIANSPKTTTTQKSITIFSKKRPTISSKRLLNLMSSSEFFPK